MEKTSGSIDKIESRWTGEWRLVGREWRLTAMTDMLNRSFPTYMQQPLKLCLQDIFIRVMVRIWTEGMNTVYYGNTYSKKARVIPSAVKANAPRREIPKWATNPIRQRKSQQIAQRKRQIARGWGAMTRALQQKKQLRHQYYRERRPCPPRIIAQILSMERRLQKHHDEVARNRQWKEKRLRREKEQKEKYEEVLKQREEERQERMLSRELREGQMEQMHVVETVALTTYTNLPQAWQRRREEPDVGKFSDEEMEGDDQGPLLLRSTRPREWRGLGPERKEAGQEWFDELVKNPQAGVNYRRYPAAWDVQQ
jgi:hypothetical protein